MEKNMKNETTSGVLPLLTTFRSCNSIRSTARRLVTLEKVIIVAVRLRIIETIMNKNSKTNTRSRQAPRSYIPDSAVGGQEAMCADGPCLPCTARAGFGFRVYCLGFRVYCLGCIRA